MGAEGNANMHRQSFAEMVLEVSFLRHSILPVLLPGFNSIHEDSSTTSLICRSDLEAVVSSCVKTSLGQGPDQAADDATVEAILRSAEFSQAKPGDEPCMSLEDFRKWSKAVPAVRRLLESLMADPEAGKSS